MLEKFVYVYNFEKLERIKKFETCQNLKGLIAVSVPLNASSEQSFVFAFPHTSKGVVNVQLSDGTQKLLTAHDGNIHCLALNCDGTRLATASEKGTLIRIFDTVSGDKLQEVRRGADRAAIYSIAFNGDSSFFCCSSDKGTIHVFAHKKPSDEQQQALPVAAPEKEDSTQAVLNRKSKYVPTKVACSFFLLKISHNYT